MKKTITMMSDLFENSESGEKVNGITIMIDGSLRKYFEIVKMKNPRLKSDFDVMREIIEQGMKSVADCL